MRKVAVVVVGGKIPSVSVYLFPPSMLAVVTTGKLLLRKL